MNVLSNLDEIANLIIRPVRYHYKLSDLGSRAFKVADHDIVRRDFEIKNQRSQTIRGSIFCQKQCKNVDYALIYLHCNSGCRVEGMTYLKKAVLNGLAYVVFDFSGSGISDGKYVSLGHFEVEDLEAVYEEVKKSLHESVKFILWGRSMGAVTTLKFLLRKRRKVSLAILDSPFKSLKELFIQTGKQKTNFPEILLEVAFRYIRPIIAQKADFDIEEVSLDMKEGEIRTPALFIASKTDSLVPFRQVDELFQAYAGAKEMIFIEEEHNQARRPETVESVFGAIKKQIAQEGREKIKKERTIAYLSQLPDRKELSRKKLSLTIKSLSQRQLAPARVALKEPTLVTKVPSEREKHQNRRGPAVEEEKASQMPQLGKKPISCLLPFKNELCQLESEVEQEETPPKILNPNKSESKLNAKRKPLAIKNFFNESSHEGTANRPESGGQNVIKFKNKLLEQSKAQVVSSNPLKLVKGHKNSVKESKSLINNSLHFHSTKRQNWTNEDPSEPLLLKRDRSKTKNFRGSGKSQSQIKFEGSNSQVEDFKGQSSEISRENCESLNYVTHRQVKCTERVLQKIIEKQQKKVLILNANKKGTGKLPNHQEPKQRKTLQHISTKNKLVVGANGDKKFRNSLECKYRTENVKN